MKTPVNIAMPTSISATSTATISTKNHDEKKLPPDYIDIAQGLALCALFFSKQGKYKEAEALCTQAGTIYTEALGAKHPSVAFCLNILAAIHQAQGDLTKARSFYERALEIWEQTVAPTHTDLRSCQAAYQALLQTMADYREEKA